MTPLDSKEIVDRRIDRSVQFMMEWHKEADLLGTLPHEAPDFAPRDALPNYEAVAEACGLHLFYVGAEVSAFDSYEPLYYILLSPKEELTLDDVMRIIPGFEPIRPQEWLTAA
jgi:hypothetical protein